MKRIKHNPMYMVGCLLVGIWMMIPCMSVNAAEDEEVTCTVNGIIYNLNETTAEAAVDQKADSSLTELVIPQTITNNGKTYTVTSIDECAFWEDKTLTKVTLPDSITTIGYASFINCTSLSEINIPKHVKTIEQSAFNYCVLLKEVILPNSLVTIGKHAFYKTGIRKIVIPSSVRRVGCSAFSSTLLQEVYISEGVTNVEESAFSSCSDLNKVTLASSMKKLPKEIFQNCTNLRTINIPNGITVIEDLAFLDCSLLHIVSLPEGMTRIGDAAFQNCTQLWNIQLPQSLSYIGDDAFSECNNLTKLDLPVNLKEIGTEAFLHCSLKEIIIPENVQKIGVNVYTDRSIMYYPKQLENRIKDYTLSHYIRMLISYVVNADGTVSLTVEQNGGSMCDPVTALELPDKISGRTISSITYANQTAVRKVICKNHYTFISNPVTQNQHTRVCRLCKTVITQPHKLEKGVCTECGYVPFTLTSEKKTIVLDRSSSADTTLSIAATPTTGKEVISYQWYENGSAIAGANTNAYIIPAGKNEGTYTYYCKASCGEYSADSETISVTLLSLKDNGHTLVDPQSQELKKGDYFTVEADNAVYRVLKAGNKGTLAYVHPIRSESKIQIPESVNVGSITYTVTAIDSNALKKETKTTTIEIGKNVRSIGANAFSGCGKLKTIKIHTSKLTKKNMGKNIFAKTSKKMTIKVPKKKKTLYRSMFIQCGMSKKVTFQKL